jgi:hypothetical protein
MRAIKTTKLNVRAEEEEQFRKTSRHRKKMPTICVLTGRDESLFQCDKLWETIYKERHFRINFDKIKFEI